MNDPHVVALIYRVEHGNSVDYRKAEPLIREEPAFRVEVKDNQARFELKDHYATEEDARNAIKDYIDDWEFDACLKHGLDFFRLQFVRPQIVDRNPTPGEINLQATLTGLIVGSVSATLTVGTLNYPPPPSGVNFRNPDVQTMYQRYMGYRRGTEPLASMAYFCLTVLEHSTGRERKRYSKANAPKDKKKGKRNEVEGKYQIDLSVLDMIGELSSEKGGGGARKADGVGNDFTSEKQTFLKHAIKRIIRRVAEKAHSPDKELPQISLSDLPPI